MKLNDKHKEVRIVRVEMSTNEFMDRALEHFNESVRKRPVFADGLASYDFAKDFPAERLAREVERMTKNGTCDPSVLVLAELSEITEALVAHDFDKAEEECYDCVAVLMRWIGEILGARKLEEE